VAIVLAALVAGGLSVLPMTPAPATAPREAGAGTAGSSENLSLAIVPGSWTMMASSTAVFTVAVVGVPSGCSVADLTANWWLPGWAAVAGFLNRSAGPSVAYTTFASESGSLGQLSVDGTVILACSGTEESDWAQGSAGVTILPTTNLAGPYLTPDPAVPGAPVLVGWQLSGGLPPYRVTVTFGDGTSSQFTQDASGPGETVHRYAAGSFAPALGIEDSQGHGLNESSGRPMTVASGLVAVIEGPGPSVDAGRPFVLTANVSGGEAPYDVHWKGPGAPFIGDSWGLVVGSTGIFNASIEVDDVLGELVTASIELQVVRPPTLSVLVPPAGCDSGVAFPVRFNVTGGVGPFRVGWGIAPAGSNSSTTLASDGSYLEPATAASAGAGWLSATIVDALGANQTTAAPLAPVHALPASVVSATPPEAEAGQPVRVTATVVGGTPPFRWSLVPTELVASPSTESGLLLEDGLVSLSGAVEAAGNLTVIATFTDANGISTTGNASVRILPPLRPLVAVVGSPAVSGAPLQLSGLLAGGVPPYDYGWTMSDGESGLGNLSGAGTFDFTATPHDAGYLTFRLWVTDALTAQANATGDVLVESGPAPVGPSNPPSSGVASGASWSWAIIAALAVVGVWAGVRFRRPATPPRPTPPPGSAGMAVVRRILEDSGELERDTLTFLAEEEGVDADAAIAAVERWSRAGKIRTENGGDGEMLLRWSGGSAHDPRSPPGVEP